MLFAQFLNQVADLDDLLGVQAHGGLVQDQNVRIADQCLGDAHTLAVSFGQVADEAVVHVRDFYQLANFIDVLLSGDFDLVEIIDKIQIILDGHIQIERGQFRQIPDFGFCLDGIVQNFMAVDGDGAGCGGQIAGDDVHGRGFTGAVGAQKTKDFSLIDGEGDIIHGVLFAVLFYEVFYLYHSLSLLSKYMEDAACPTGRGRPRARSESFIPTGHPGCPSDG